MSLTSNSTANNLNDPNDLFDLSVEQYIQKYVFGCNTFEDPHPPPHPPPPRPPAFFHFTHDDSTVQNIINKLELSPFVSNLFIQEEEGEEVDVTVATDSVRLSRSNLTLSPYLDLTRGILLKKRKRDEMSKTTTETTTETTIKNKAKKQKVKEEEKIHKSMQKALDANFNLFENAVSIPTNVYDSGYRQLSEFDPDLLPYKTFLAKLNKLGFFTFSSTTGHVDADYGQRNSISGLVSNSMAAKIIVKLQEDQNESKNTRYLIGPQDKVYPLGINITKMNTLLSSDEKMMMKKGQLRYTTNLDMITEIQETCSNLVLNNFTSLQVFQTKWDGDNLKFFSNLVSLLEKL